MKSNDNLGNKISRFKPGDRVQIKDASEILATLDEHGCLGNLPFMPEMLQYCGERFTISHSAHKTCDTVNKTGGRRLPETVHIEGLRCDGSSHGGCQAACLLFWKDEWLRPADMERPAVAGDRGAPDTGAIERYCHREPGANGEAAYNCQATALPEYTELLLWWDFRQYFRDLATGNTGFGKFMYVMVLAVFRKLAAIGVGMRAVVALYNLIQKPFGGRPYAIVGGTLSTTPVEKLDLQPGEYVRVKSLEEINKTLDRHQKNRGLWFDQEMARFCGGNYRVLRNVEQILDERTGKMLKFSTPSVILEGVFCESEYSSCRLFCPRRIYSYWREIWLERVDKPS